MQTSLDCTEAQSRIDVSDVELCCEHRKLRLCAWAISDTNEIGLITKCAECGHVVDFQLGEIGVEEPSIAMKI
jgi:hypothetical protein